MGPMDESVRLGRVAGVPVGANWSLLVIFWLFVISLAGAQLPHSAPGQADDEEPEDHQQRPVGPDRDPGHLAQTNGFIHVVNGAAPLATEAVSWLNLGAKKRSPPKPHGVETGLAVG